MKRTKTTPDARDRLLATADRLFYAEGIHAVGIDRIIAEAGVAKMTLYTHFPSKDDLIVAVLRHRAEAFQASFTQSLEKHAKAGKDPLRAFFAALKNWFESPGFRGCAFINAAVELADPAHEGSVFAREYKCQFNGFLREIAEKTLGKSGASLVPAFSLLVEGAIVTAAMQGSSAPADTARETMLQLVRDAKE